MPSDLLLDWCPFFSSLCLFLPRNDRSIFSRASMWLLWSCVLVSSAGPSRYMLQIMSTWLFIYIHVISIQNIPPRHFHGCVSVDHVDLDICRCFHGCLQHWPWSSYRLVDSTSNIHIYIMYLCLPRVSLSTWMV